MIDHHGYLKLKPEKIKQFRCERDRTRDLCDTGAVSYPEPSYKAVWEKATLWVYNVPVEGE